MRAMEQAAWSLEETQARVRLSLRDGLSGASSASAGKRRARSISTASGAIHLERLNPLPGREAMLRALAGQGSISGSSATRPARCCGAKSSSSAGPIFSAASSAPATRRPTSPPATPVHLALAPSGVPAGDEVWFVGDTAIDMECARNSGCVAVLLGAAAPPEEFARFAPRSVVCRRARPLSLARGVAICAPRAHLRRRYHAQPALVCLRPGRPPRLQKRWGDYP